MEPDESENSSAKMRRKQADDDKTLEKDHEMLNMKSFLWNSKYYILENKTTTAVHLINIQWWIKP